MYRVAHLTDSGLKRENNEDALLIDSNYGLFLVADGMGGHERGEVASRIVIDSFQEILCKSDDETITYISDNFDNEETIGYSMDDDDDEETLAYYHEESLEDRLNRAVELSTRKIIDYAHKTSTGRQMGTTVVGLYKIEDKEELAVFHLGDSRAYRIRDSKIERLTTDHSKYELMRQSGRYSEEELEKINRSSITKAIGNFKEIPIEVDYIDIKKGDIYILCSDGVSDLCSDLELYEIVNQNQDSFESATDKIRNLVYNRGAKDNLSIVIFGYKLI